MMGYDGSFSDHVARWYAKIPENQRDREYQKTIQCFQKKYIRMVTDDVIIAYGIKPE